MQPIVFLSSWKSSEKCLLASFQYSLGGKGLCGRTLGNCKDSMWSLVSNIFLYGFDFRTRSTTASLAHWHNLLNLALHDWNICAPYQHLFSFQTHDHLSISWMALPERLPARIHLTWCFVGMRSMIIWEFNRNRRQFQVYIWSPQLHVLHVSLPKALRMDSKFW